MNTASARVDHTPAHQTVPGEFELVHCAYATPVMGQFHSFCGLAFFAHEVKDDDRIPSCLWCVVKRSRNGG